MQATHHPQKLNASRMSAVAAAGAASASVGIKKARTEGSLKEDDKDLENTPVTLRVGDCVYKTTREVLLGRDSDSFFHVQLSGRWNTTSMTQETHQDAAGHHRVVTIDRCGETFADVLYYLRFGDLPRNPTTRRCLLDTGALALLEAEAEFFNLPGLVNLCKDSSPPPMFMVTKYDMDSDKHSWTKVFQFESYDKAKAFYEKRTEDNSDVIVYDEVAISAEPDFEHVHYLKKTRPIVDPKTNLAQMECFENGNCKRSSGISLCVWHTADEPVMDYFKAEKTEVDGAIMMQDVRSWPDASTYSY